MPKSVFGGAHLDLISVLIEAQKAAGLTQEELGARIGKDQTFISLIERSQRRVDVLELVVLAKALNIEAETLFSRIIKRLPKDFHI